MLFSLKSIYFLKGKFINAISVSSILILKNLNLILSCAEFKILYNYLKMIIQQKKVFGLNNQKVSFFRYKIKKRFTVIKSPFVNKKSKSQYDVRLFGSRLSYFFYNSVFYFLFLKKIQDIFHSKNCFSTDFVKYLLIDYYL